MPFDIQAIRSIARSERYQKDREKESPRERCIDWTLSLVRRLRERGYAAVRVYGVIHPDGYRNPDGTVTFSRDSWAEDWVNHNWAMVDGWVVDISADQFNDLLLRDRFAKVYLRPLSEAKRHEALEIV